MSQDRARPQPQRSSRSRSTTHSIRRRTIAPLTASLLLVACSTGGDADQVAVTTPATSDAPSAPTPDTTDALEAEPVDASTDTHDPIRRSLPLALRPESELASNALPSVEIHDVGQDRMVNFRNVFPAERPVLLWMWAPY